MVAFEWPWLHCMLVYNCFSNFSNWIFPSRFHLDLSQAARFSFPMQWMMYQPVHTLRIYINFMSEFIVKTDIFARETTLCTRFVAIRSGLVKVQNQMKQTSLNEITFTKLNQLQLKHLPKNNTCFCFCFDVCNVIILIFPVWPFSMLNNNCHFDDSFFFTLNMLFVAMVLIQILPNRSSIFETLQTK